jgi:alkanesulfonate monooxygenase SsuD/methylene tetrahydromethanopterin reductase-like flavin-dependent oxidoreductase (luciferase family)
MRFAIEVTGFGTYANPSVVADVALAAEAAGWDGLFIWDHLGWAAGIPSGDPWVSLAAAATRTERIVLGLDVCPLPRRRPQVVATAVAALDQLSGGRVVFGAGLGGSDAEYSTFGEDAEAGVRAAKLDESLGLLDQFWRGERVEHHGEHFSVAGATLSPRPVQRPRPPIWIGGASAPALRRASRWDGYTVGTIVDEHGDVTITPTEVRKRIDQIGPGPSFDVAVSGSSAPGSGELPRQFADAGATWWLECVHDFRGPLPEMLDRVRSGP